MANTKLSFTPSQDGTRTKYTFSFWIKRSGLSSGQSPIVSSDLSNSNNTYSMIYFVNDVLAFYSTDNGQTLYFLTNQKFRDVNGWYHIVVAYDSPQATSSNRVKMYVNGEQITSWDTASYPSQNADNTWFNRAYEMVIGTRSYDNNTYFDGVMSHFHFCDGYAYSASDFGSTDATTGEWKINTSPNVNYGTNGFFILKDGNSVTDQSGNSHNWTVNAGTLTKTEDNPSNVFATLNSLNIPTSNAPTFENGNTASTTSSSGSGKFGGSSTLGMTSGKWYCEARAKIPGSSRNVFGLSGAVSLVARNNNSFLSDTDNSIGWYSADGTVAYNNSSQYTASSYANDDILMIAVDMDNLKVYLGKNGTWQNSGVPTSGSTGTGAITIAAASSCHDGAYFFCFSDDTSTSAVAKFEYNFGNGYFGTTAVSSAGTNASGIGIFEYDVPAGYTALCTKGLNL